MSDLPPEALDDCFRPPDIPVEVHCLHCGREYDSYLIWWDEHIVDGERGGFWRCPTPGCDGAGFGFDIWPVNGEYRDGDREFIWSDDEEDDEAYEEEDEEFDLGPRDELSPSDDLGWDAESVPW
ncbi:MAG: hypothetical protein SYC29_17775 [Planctomycetota bacterium]|nr:hypothetical protein [Planctomycetota bacterium]